MFLSGHSIVDSTEHFPVNNTTSQSLFRCSRSTDDDSDLWEVSGVKTSPNGQQSIFKYYFLPKICVSFLSVNIVLAYGSLKRKK